MHASIAMCEIYTGELTAYLINSAGKIEGPSGEQLRLASILNNSHKPTQNKSNT